MAKANDDFEELSADTALGSHTPTGTDAGINGWVVIGGGGITVLFATDIANSTTNNNGNRARMDDDLGSDEINVEAEISYQSSITTANGVAGGVTTRMDNADNPAAYQLWYDWTSGGTFGSYVLEDSSGEDALEEEWETPEDFKVLRIETRNSDHSGLVDGTPKVSRSTNLGTGDNYAGLVLLDFSSEVDPVFANNYISEGVNVPAEIVAAITQQPHQPTTTPVGAIPI